MSSNLTVEQLIGECTELSRQLDSIGSRDDRAMIALTLEQGWKSYRNLRTSGDALSMTASEVALVQIMLDGLLARLKFLEKRA